MEEIKAKSIEQGGSSLYKHSISVSNLATRMAERLLATRMAERLTDNKELIIDVRISSLFHDIGKSTNSFQLYIKEKDKRGNKSKKIKDDDIIYHNEISWAYLHECGYNDDILNAVLYHHPTNKDDNRICDILDSISDNDYTMLGEMYKSLQTYIGNNSLNKSFIRTGNNDDCGYPAYFEFDSNKFRRNNFFPDSNTRVLFIKGCLISSDRLVSELEYKHDIRIDSIINNDLGIIDSIIEGCIMMDKEYYLQCPSHFDIDRFHIQQSSSLEAIKERLMIIQAPAGYGKTIIGLDYITKLKNKAIWVCPRNIIATSTYDSIIRELDVFGLCMKVSLLLSDEVKACNFKSDNVIRDSDIVVTNIDNYLISTVKNDHQNRLYNLIGSTVIFDEFHELVDSTAIFGGFLNVVRCRDKYCNSHTLLMSATPMELERRLSDNSVRKISIDSFNDSLYKIIVHDIGEVFNPSIDNCNSDSLVIYNSISLAQDMYKEHIDKATLLHSLYMTNDLNKLRSDITTNHDKFSIIEDRRPVIGCRIIGTGLDISFLTLHESVSTPEYTLQAIGRVNRFNEYKDKATPTIHIYLNDNKPERGAVEINSTLSIRNLWYNFIKDNVDGNEIPIKGIYELYNKFYKSNEYITLYNKLIKEKLCESLESYSKIKPFRNKKKLKNSKIIKISKYGLRCTGKQIFAIARMNDGSGFISEPIQINTERVNEKEKRLNNKRNTVIKNLDKMDKYGYDVYKKNPLSEDKIIENAVWNTKPYVLLTYEYDKNIGLYKI